MLIIASKPGQLGNRLLLFAQFVAIASERGLTVSNPSFEEFADFFETTAGDLLCRFPARRSPLPRGPLARRLFYQLSYHAARLLVRCRVRRGPMRAVQIEWEERVDIAGEEFLAALRPRQLVFMQGWQFDAGPALARRAPVIREFFRPLGRFRDNVEEHVRRAREGADVLVGVHVRHGDYRTFLGGKYFYELETYVELMRQAESLFPGRRVSFLVCSNAEHVGGAFEGFRHTRGTGHLVEDLYALAGCDYLVGPPSTFTMWASLYGGVPLCMVEDPRRALRLEDFAVYLGDERAGAAEPAVTSS